MTTGSQEPHQQDVTETTTADVAAHDGDHERGDMGGNTGPTQPSTRGGSGLGPDAVRAADAAASRGD